MNARKTYALLQKKLASLITSRDKKKGVLEMKRKELLERMEVADIKEAAKAFAEVSKACKVSTIEFAAACRRLNEITNEITNGKH